MMRKIALMSIVMLAMATTASAKSAGQWLQGVEDAADYMLQFQNDDGGFPYKLTNPVAASYDSTAGSPANTLGATARGLVAAYEVTGHTRYLNAANNVADLIEYRYDNNINVGSYGPPFYNKDIEFAYELAAAGGKDITAKAQTSAVAYFNSKLSGSTASTAAQAVYEYYLNANWTASPGAMSGAKMWMLGDWASVGAILGTAEISSGYTGDDFASEMNSLMENDYGNGFDPEGDTYAALGQYGMLEAAYAATGGAGNTTVLEDIRENLYSSDPSFGYQSLGYTTYLLSLLDDPAAARGSEILLSWQRDDGAWIYSDGDWYVESHGEALLGVASSPVPEPLTMLAVGSAVAGLGGYIRRRRRA
jgi:hypothetical protein